MKAVLENKENRFEHDYENDESIFELDKIELFTFYKFNNSVYLAGRINRSKDYAVIEEIFLNENPKSEEYEFESNIKCPYCNYLNADSWEMDDESDNCECGSCGSIISYKREVEITYRSNPVKMSPVVEVNNG